MPKNVSRDRLSSVNGTGRRWASTKQTAVYLGVTERTVRLMADDGRLTQYYLGPNRAFRPERGRRRDDHREASGRTR